MSRLNAMFVVAKINTYNSPYVILRTNSGNHLAMCTELAIAHALLGTHAPPVDSGSLQTGGIFHGCAVTTRGNGHTDRAWRQGRIVPPNSTVLRSSSIDIG